MIEPADRILIDAIVYPGRAAGPTRAALAIRAGRIAAVGAADNLLTALRGNATHIDDLGGAFVMPGFVDVHNHHAIAGRRALFELTIEVDDDLAAIVAAVRKRAAGLQDGAWLVGGGWSPALLDVLATESALQALDDASIGHPVVLRDQSCHNRWVNSAALRMVGPAVAQAAADRGPELILRDRITGRPSGVLLEEAGLPVEWALNASQPVDPAQHVAASQHAIGTLHRYGITAFQDAASSLEIMRALHSLDAAGDLRAWVVSSAVLNDPMFGFAPIGAELIESSRGLAGPRHRPSFVKIFLDGIPPMYTAALLAPYRPDNLHGDAFCGQTTFPTEVLAEQLHQLATAGLSVKIHCTGDASVRVALDAIERVRRAGLDAPRFHVAHGQLVDPADIPRFAALDVAADISPFVWFPGVIPDAIAAVVPAPLSGHIHPIRDLSAAGALVCGGSDWPVSETPNPWVGVHGLVTRRDPHGDYAEPLWPQQAVGVADALDIFTVNGAQAMGLGHETGALRTGLSADFLVTDHNPFEADPGDLAGITVEQTWFAGEPVFTRGR